jgi:large subunit ribosomal protein L17
MRHRVAYRKLGRITSHRIAMLRNQASALIDHGRVQTTVAKAKELRPFVERLISVAKRSLDAPAGSSRSVTARRTVAQDIADRAVVQKLFSDIAPRYTARAGGYTRILRLGYRRGDSAEVAEIELLGSEYDPNAVAKADKGGDDGGGDTPKKKTMGERLRGALGRGPGTPGGQEKGKVVKHAKGAPKSTTPRKAGGS